MSNKTFKKLFTSESVTEGHPDKVADQISDAVLDSILEQDPTGRVACETMVAPGRVMVAGEVTTSAEIPYEKVIRKSIEEIGYTEDDFGFNCHTCEITNLIHGQSPDIAMGVDETSDKEQGAGDQGMMFGYATNETKELMPLPILLAHQLTHRLSVVRKEGILPFLRPDGKSQVTIEYNGSKPMRAETIVISTQHADDVSQEELRKRVIEEVARPTIPDQYCNSGDVNYHINPTGRFVIGGPQGDCGITGRKIIVDTYGGSCRHGGGAFSGKDPTKVDRSAAYMTRYIAKNVVAAGLADQCEVQIAYAIGVAEPVSVLVETHGTGKIPEDRLAVSIRDLFPLKPKEIIDYLDLRKPQFRKTAAYGHFGREDQDFAWEKVDKVDELRKKAGL